MIITDILQTYYRYINIKSRVRIWEEHLGKKIRRVKEKIEY